MLIIPIEKKPDWRHPPWACITLVLINTLIFAFYQSNDDSLWNEAFDTYKSHRLLQWEKPLFLEYSKQEQRLSVSEQKEILSSPAANALLTQMILSDREFDLYVRNYWNTQIKPQERNLLNTLFNEDSNKPAISQSQLQEWQAYRLDIEKIRARVSSIEYGITPAEPTTLNFITTQFMHGSWDHLIGNMVFLCLFGITLELALGSLAFLSLYLITGVAASAFYVGVNWGSYTSAIGASGAVSGLMGMYLALYRLQKIRFFYNLAFYFGEFKAPALLILPLWLGKELFGYFFTDTNIAYWAHIGGLVSGALLLLPIRDKILKIDNDELIDTVRIEKEQLTPRLAQINQAVGQLNLEKAKILSRKLVKDHPEYDRAWSTGFELMKRTPNSKEFHQFTFDLLKNACQQPDKPEWRLLIENVLTEYQQLVSKPVALNAGLSTLLAKTLLRLGDHSGAEQLAKLAISRGGKSEPLQLVLTKLINYYQQRQQLERSRDLALERDKLSSIVT